MPCQQANQLIYDDRKSGAARDVSVWTVGVSQLGIPSPDNYGMPSVGLFMFMYTKCGCVHVYVYVCVHRGASVLYVCG